LRVFGLVLTESLLLSSLGGILGVMCSVFLLSSTGMSVAAEGVTIAFEPSLKLAMQGVLVAVVVGLLAGLAPGWQASRTEIVSALRHA
jgi:putative ABC transport system permease protein